MQDQEQMHTGWLTSTKPPPVYNGIPYFSTNSRLRPGLAKLILWMKRKLILEQRRLTFAFNTREMYWRPSSR